MIIPLLTAVVLAGLQSPAKSPAVVSAPVLPAGISAEFGDAVAKVEASLAKGDFEAAKRGMALLPKHKIVICYDDSAAPASRRHAFITEARAAIDLWVRGHPLQVEFVGLGAGHSDLKIDFAKRLANYPGGDIPRGVALFFNEAADQPRLEAVVGLSRGVPLTSTQAQDVYDDVAFAFGRYLGLAENPVNGGLMHQTPGVVDYRPFEEPIEIVGSQRLMDVVDELDKAISDHKTMTPTAPNLFLDPKKLDMPAPIIQGTTGKFEIQFTNTGSGPMAAQIIPDCSCFSVTDQAVIPAGESRIFSVHMDTSQYGGPVHKELYVLTNDPNHSWTTIPVDVRVTPRVRFLTPNGTTFYPDNLGKHATIFMAVQGDPLKVTQYGVSGAAATVLATPWTGDLPDSALNEPSQTRTGYRFDIVITGDLMPGRTNFSLDVKTDDSSLPMLHTPFYFQTGIVATPNPLFMGTVSSGRSVFPVRLIRPGRPFHILGLTSTSPYFKAAIASGDSLDDRIIHLKYNGLAVAGPINGVLKIKTDDPTQKTIEVPFSGEVE